MQLTFEQQLSRNTHSRLLSFPPHTKHAQPRPTRTEGLKNDSLSKPVRLLVSNQPLSAPTNFSCSQESVREQEEYDENQESSAVDIARVAIVSGTDQKKRILDTYQALYGEGFSESIVVAKKGKHHHNETPSHSSARMRPSNDKKYSVMEITLYKDCRRAGIINISQHTRGGRSHGEGRVERERAIFLGLGGGDKEFSKLDTVPSRKPSVDATPSLSLQKGSITT